MTLLGELQGFPAQGVGKADRADALGQVQHQISDEAREQQARLALLTLQWAQTSARIDATCASNASMSRPRVERNELADREDDDLRRKFPWRYAD